MATSSNHPRIFILPRKDSFDNVRIVTLPHPQNGSLTKFYLDPSTGLYEIRRVTVPKRQLRSCLLAPNVDQSRDSASSSSSAGYILEQPDMFVTTRIDPLFLVLRVLCGADGAARGKQALFVSSEDYFDRIRTEAPDFAEVLSHPNIKVMIEGRMAAVCDTVEAGDERCFRLDEQKLSQVLLQKAESMIAAGLPPSLEERFVRKALEKPVTQLDEEPAVPPTLTPTGSNVSTTTVESVFSTATADSTDTAATSVSEPEAKDDMAEVLRLLRLRTALDYLKFVYLPSSLSHILPPASIDFKPLETHLSELDALRQAAVAAHDVSSYSRKRAFEAEDEVNERMNAKKLKEDEEKRKKANESRAMRELKKVNVKGMKKMSDFFGKPASKAAAK